MEYKIFTKVDVTEEDLKKVMEDGTFSQVREFLDGCIKAEFVEYLPYELASACLEENNRLDKELDDANTTIKKLTAVLAHEAQQRQYLEAMISEIKKAIPDIKPTSEWSGTEPFVNAFWRAEHILHRNWRPEDAA